MANNKRILDNTGVSAGLAVLRDRLPPTWSLDQVVPEQQHNSSPDARATLRGGDGSRLPLGIEFRRRLEPRDVAALAEQIARWQPHRPDQVPLVMAPFLSPRTRQLLTQAQLGHLDLVGNCWLTCERPALFLCTSGLDHNPDPELRPARSLHGAVAGRVVRALCDYSMPVGVRELASRAQADPGYVSRLVQLLETEVLLERQPRGPIQVVHWEALLRRWAADFNPLTPDAIRAFLEPRGLPALTEKLATAPFRYAVTGSLAAFDMIPIAPPRLAVVYVEDPPEAARALGLIPAEAGINVWLVRPFDPVVFLHSQTPLSTESPPLWLAAASQVVVDLLHSPGRGPQEAEALFTWMAEHEHAWRA